MLNLYRKFKKNLKERLIQKLLVKIFENSSLDSLRGSEATERLISAFRDEARIILDEKFNNMGIIQSILLYLFLKGVVSA
jgi:hypothetical protein